MDSKIEENKITSEPASQSTSGGAHPAQSQLPDERIVTALARSAVETFVSEQRVIEPMQVSESSLLNQKLACFVSIKTINRELRGCIGTIEPEKNRLASEIIFNAIKAATCDPRFPPVSNAELPFLRYSVDVLEPPEPAKVTDLDPATFGVVVMDDLGFRRGLLLPNIEGIKTAGQQVHIAARKAGIEDGKRIILYRFRTRRFSEPT
jgi:AmmeMemoRadiSam system protein A